MVYPLVEESEKADLADATQGAKDLDEKKADAAFDQFREAYVKLKALVDEVGLIKSGKFASGAGLPEPLAARHLQ